MESLFEKVNKELVANANRLQKTYEMLESVGEIEVGTAAKDLVWQQDRIKLYRYSNDKVSCKVPVLIVYALVNTYKMMDIQPDRSFIRRMLSEGLDVYLIDWGGVGQAEKYLTIEDYVQGYVNDCVDFIRKAHSLEKINLLGVCQGGTFSVMYSALNPQKVQNLVTLVTPIDFDINEGLLFKWSKDLDVDKIVDAHNGIVPGRFLDFAFDMLKPMNKTRKYSNLLNMFDDEARLANFLRMEKWISDTPDQAGETYRQFIKDLYKNNKLVKGEMELGGKKIDLKNITMPTLTIYASEDHIVPPASTKPLNELIGSTDKELYEFPGGHIGVFVGARSQKELAPTLAAWLKKRV